MRLDETGRKSREGGGGPSKVFMFFLRTMHISAGGSDDAVSGSSAVESIRDGVLHWQTNE